MLGLLLITIVGTASSARAQSDITDLEVAYPNISFTLPLGIVFQQDRVYIAEYAGRVMVMDNDPAADEATVFLDISDRLATDPPGEFFAIAFHPDYEENGYFFVRYKLQDPHRTVLSRFQRSESNPLEADLASEVVLLEIETPGNANNHHGGALAFGPDGYLYVPLGDGGVYLDAVGNAQDRSKLLGKVLRLDVDNPAGGLHYGIPPDNPYVGNEEGWREEIFAYGFRNPWRLTIDRATGDVWVGDVGESAWEEVDLVEAGHNYGWPIMEGPVCQEAVNPDCDQTGLTLPVWAYSHDLGASITGGYVYRGSKIPALQGKYVFTDFMTGRLWAVDPADPSEATQLEEPGFNITTFGEDATGELYFTQYWSGKIWKVVPGPGASSTDDEPLAPSVPRVAVYPNPVRDAATVRLSGEAQQVRLALYDVLGRAVRHVYDGSGVPGGRELGLDARGLAPGVYFLRMEADGHTQTQKVVVTR